MALPTDSRFTFLAISVPSTFQQGVIPDGEEPPWGMLRVVASARERYGIDAGILDAHRLKLDQRGLREQLKTITPGVVGLNPTSVNVREAQHIAGICDDLGIPYLLGGVHATIDPAVARSDFPNAAAIIRGNAEVAIGPSVRAIIDDVDVEIQGVYFRGHSGSMHAYAQRMPADELPFVNQEKLVVQPIYTHTVTINGRQSRIDEATLFVTQGCPYKCTFCASPVMTNRTGRSGRPYDRPATDRIVAEVAHVVDELGANAVHFLDDMAFPQAPHIKEFHDQISRAGLLGKFVWRGLGRASLIERFDDRTLELMKESGAWRVTLGIESGSEEILRQIDKRVTARQAAAAVDRLSRHGIQTKGYFIMGFPTETERQMLETRDLMMRLRDAGMAEASVFQFHPYPGTGEYSRLAESKPDIIAQLPYLRGGDPKNQAGHNTWLPPDLEIADVPSSVVQRHVIAAMADFYGGENTS